MDFSKKIPRHPSRIPAPPHSPAFLLPSGSSVNPLTHASFVTHAFFHLFCHISVRIPVSIPAIRSGVADAVLLGLPPSPLNYSKLTAIGVQTPFIATSRSHLVIVTGLPSKWFTLVFVYILFPQSALSHSCYPEYLPLPTAPRSCFRRALR